MFYFIPFLFMFAAFIRVQRLAVPPGVRRTPGGALVATSLGAVGFTTTAVSIVLAAIPAGDDPHPALAVAKIVGLSVVMCSIGAAVFLYSPIDKLPDGWSD